MSARPVTWYQDTQGARVAVLYTGTQVHLHVGHSPPGEHPDDGHAHPVLWARLVGDDWPEPGWWTLDTRPEPEPWVHLVTRAGGSVPDQLALAYWRTAYYSACTRLTQDTGGTW